MQREDLAKYISMTHRMINKTISKELEKYDISFCHMIYLLRLYHQDGVMQDELKRFTSKDKATIARAIKKLEQLGYIRRERDVSDKRAYKVYLTEKSWNIQDDIYEILNKNSLMAENGVTQEEKEITIKVLMKMAWNYKEHIEREFDDK